MTAIGNWYGLAWRRVLTGVPRARHSDGVRGRSRRSGLMILSTGLLCFAVLMGDASAAAAAARKSHSSSTQSHKIVWWFWGTSDVPGIGKWLNAEVTAYEKSHHNVTISIVPQGTTTLEGAFQTAATTRSGPTIETHWATIPTLQQVFAGYVTPITSLVKKKTIKTWVNTDENVYKRKLWAMPVYLLGTPLAWNKNLFKKAGLDPTRGPRTWAQFLSDCSKLKAAGINPILGGDKTGALGSWLIGLVGDQNLTSPKQVEEMAIGKYSVGKGFGTGISKIDGLFKAGYFNSNFLSVDETQTYQEFAQGKGAFIWMSDGEVLTAQKVMPSGSIGVESTPVWGHGKLAHYYDVTQSSDEFITSWAANKKPSAAFLSWLKQPAQVASFYSKLGAFPASTYFKAASDIKDPLAKQLYALDSRKNQVWLENFFPTYVTTTGLRPAIQNMFTGKSVKTTVKYIEQSYATWRAEQPAQLKEFTQWVRSQRT